MKLFASMALGLSLLAGLAFPARADDGADSSVPDWVNRIKFNGDLRLRYDAVDEEDLTNRSSGRFRIRFGATAAVADDIKVVFQVASGGDNPVSGNQSFDDGFTTKDIGIDLAYVDWRVNENLNVYGGKMKNPLYRAGAAPVIWDGDLNPEGVAATYSSGMLFSTLGAFVVEERSSSSDSMLYAGQVGVKFGVGEGATITAGAGYFGYSDTVGNKPFYEDLPLGNTVDLSGNFVYEYKDTELFAQYDTQFGAWPLSIFGHVAQNNEVDDNDTAWAAGVRIGAAKDQGAMEFGWTYMDIEADAVVGTYTDSDFGGGRTDTSGHLVKARYVLRKNIHLGATFFINDVERSFGVEHDYNRVQLDIEFKF